MLTVVLLGRGVSQEQMELLVALVVVARLNRLISDLVALVVPETKMPITVSKVGTASRPMRALLAVVVAER